jgi:hypothetical protein
MLTDGLEGPGLFQFHNGIDIAAPQDTPVYPVVSGKARLIDGAAVSVRTTTGRTFQYFHIVPIVVNGEHVVARHTILGYVMRAYDHVHLTEIRHKRVWNPLAPGGIAPYRDGTLPEVDEIAVRPPDSLLTQDTKHVCGVVSIVAAVHDRPPLRVPGVFSGYPVSAAHITWSLGRLDGPVYVHDVPVVDFRTTLPLVRNFWNVYARGSFQNAPRFSNRQFFMAGRFIYNLSGLLDSRFYPNGRYRVSVAASDMRGNSTAIDQPITIANDPTTETGCEPQPAPPSSSP